MIATATALPIEVNLRIPGSWEDANALRERLPTGYEIDGHVFIHPHGLPMEFVPWPPDELFPNVFATAIARPAEPEQIDALDAYRMNACLIARLGSLESARRVMKATNSLLRAGGLGVFIDNSARSHIAADWVELAEGAGISPLLWAFVTVVKSSTRLYTIGMHVLGKPDVAMVCDPEDQNNQRRFDEFLEMLHLCPELIRHSEPVKELNVIPLQEPSNRFASSSPMHNPFGLWRLEPAKK